MFDLTTRAKPILKWAGGKSALLPQLLALFPTGINHYVEPFLGGAAVFLSLKGKYPSLLNDINPELIELYAVIRDHPHPLMEQLDRLAGQYCRDFYYTLRAASETDAISRAARLVFLNKTGFNGLYRQNKKGDFNVPFGKRVRCPKLYEPENVLSVSARLQTATLVNSDFEAIIDSTSHGAFVYCDPPYQPLSSTSSFNTYLGEGFSIDHQRRLRDACIRAMDRGVYIVISNSTATAISELYRDYRIETVYARRNINSKSTGRGLIGELCIIMDGPSVRSKRPSTGSPVAKQGNHKVNPLPARPRTK